MNGIPGRTPDIFGGKPPAPRPAGKAAGEILRFEPGESPAPDKAEWRSDAPPASAGQRAARIAALELMIHEEHVAMSLAAKWGVDVGDEVGGRLRCCRGEDGSVHFRSPDGKVAEFSGHGELLSHFDGADFDLAAKTAWGMAVPVSRNKKIGVVLLEERKLVAPCVNESVTVKEDRVRALAKKASGHGVDLAFYRLADGGKIGR